MLTEDAVRNALFSVLRGSDGWLKDRPDDADSVITADDIGIRSFGDGVEFDLYLGKRIEIKDSFDSDLGLPALGLNLHGQVDLMFDVDWHLGLSVSKADGIYFIVQGDSPELGVTLHVSTPELGAIGHIGFMELSAKGDAKDHSRFDGVFKLDLVDPNGDGRLTLSELSQANLANVIRADRKSVV